MDDVKMTPEEFASLWCYSSEAPLSQAVKERDARIRAEARAEALREAKGKLAAMEKLLTTRYRSDYEEGFGDALNEAQDIILADEPNERDSREGLLYKSDVDDRGEG